MIPYLNAGPIALVADAFLLLDHLLLCIEDTLWSLFTSVFSSVKHWDRTNSSGSLTWCTSAKVWYSNSYTSFCEDFRLGHIKSLPFYFNKDLKEVLWNTVATRKSSNFQKPTISVIWKLWGWFCKFIWNFIKWY